MTESAMAIAFFAARSFRASVGDADDELNPMEAVMTTVLLSLDMQPSDAGAAERDDDMQPSDAELDDD
jgi:hypothetical protein